MKAVNNWIIIDEVVEEIKASSGLIMTDVEQMRYGKGTVISVGDKVTCVKDGDTIYFDKRQGHQARLGGVLHGIIREQDVVAIL